MHHAAARSERLVLEGPAGRLEARLDLPAGDDPPGAVAVVCHPHPLYAGTMDNKVVHTLAKTFTELGLASLRFNFRGVGASKGSYAQGVGETEDALAAAAHCRQRWPHARLWLAGFSFGAAVAVRASTQVRAERLVAVAPAVDRIDIGGIMPACPWLVVLGDADDVVPPARVLEWAGALRPEPQVQVLPGAGHFFHGRLQDLRAALMAFAAA